MTERFKVWVNIGDPGPHPDYQVTECVGVGLTPQEAVNVARSWTLPNRPGVVLGTIKRVIIEDDEEFTVFEWKNGEGVTFPPESKGRI